MASWGVGHGEAGRPTGTGRWSGGQAGDGSTAGEAGRRNRNQEPRGEQADRDWAVVGRSGKRGSGHWQDRCKTGIESLESSG